MCDDNTWVDIYQTFCFNGDKKDRRMWRRGANTIKEIGGEYEGGCCMWKMCEKEQYGFYTHTVYTVDAKLYNYTGEDMEYTTRSNVSAIM